MVTKKVLEAENAKFCQLLSISYVDAEKARIAHQKLQDEYQQVLDQLAEHEVHLERLRHQRRKLPITRDSITHHFDVGGFNGDLIIGLYPDTKTPGEIFVCMSGTIGGFMDAWATMFSVALQHGATLENLCEKGIGHNFEPAGFSSDPDIGYAKSLIDYVCRWLSFRFIGGDKT